MRNFPLRYDKRARRITIAFGVMVVALLAFVFYVSGGSYLPAWFSTLFVAFALIGVLSIPKKIILSPFALEVHCLVEITRISYDKIAKIKILDKKDMRFTMPFLGIYGIFGYYGYYLDLRRMRLFRIYARRWSNFLLIEDIRGRRLVVAVEDREGLVRRLEDNINNMKL